MFAKIKEKLLEKAFGFAFSRYDTDKGGCLDKDELTSLINDVFSLMKVNRQVSWVETTLLMKMLDSDGNSSISSSEAYEAVKMGLTKFGGIQGLTTLVKSGKTSSGLPMDDDPYSHIPREDDEEEYVSSSKTGAKLDYVPPEDIDESMLLSLPPPGHNLKSEDLVSHPPKDENEKEEGSGFLL